jgi:hypothetical protein
MSKKDIALNEKSELQLGGTFYVECFRGGKLLWKEPIKNLVVNEGLQNAIDSSLLNGSQITAWYVGLLSNVTPLAAWTMTNAGGAEVTAYDEASRPVWTGVRSAELASNTASKSLFTIDTNDTDIYGAFLASNNTKGGTTGTLFAAGLFASPRTGLQDDDELYITYEVQGASS